MHRAEVVQDGGEVAEERARLARARRTAERLVDCLLEALAPVGDQVRRDVGPDRHRQVRHERQLVRVVDLHRQVGHVLDGLGQQLEQSEVRRVVALHRADLDDEAGRRREAGDVVAVGDAERERLLAQHVQPGAQGARRDLVVVGVGGRADDGIEAEVEQLVDALTRLGDAVARRQARADDLRRVGERDELEALAVLPQVEGVLRLTDEPGPHEPHPQPPCGHCASPLGTLQSWSE